MIACNKSQRRSTGNRRTNNKSFGNSNSDSGLITTKKSSGTFQDTVSENGDKTTQLTEAQFRYAYLEKKILKTKQMVANGGKWNGRLIKEVKIVSSTGRQTD